MDVLEKIREEERAKLEALKEKEQEKTRLAIEKERTRLEAELAKEIKDLESQLNRAKNASQKVKARTPETSSIVEIPSVLVEEVDNDSKEENGGVEVVTSTNPNATKKQKAKIVEVEGPESIEVEEDENSDTVIEEVVAPVKKAAPAKKTVVSKSLPTRRTPAKTAAQREKEKEKARLAKEKEREKARLAKEKEKEREKAKLAKDKEKAKLVKDKSTIVTQETTNEIKQEIPVEVTIKEPITTAEANNDIKPIVLVKREEPMVVTKETPEVIDNEEQVIVAKEASVEVVKELPVVIEEKAETEEKQALVVIKEISKEVTMEEQAVDSETPVVALKETLKEVIMEAPVVEAEKVVETKEEPILVAKETPVSIAKEEPVINVKEEPVLVMPKVDEILEKKVTLPVREEVIPTKSVGDGPISKATDLKSKPNTAMTSLQKLREKIAAQKRLERDLMEREAQKVQEKEKSLQDRFVSLQKIVEEEENIITLEELEQERNNVDNLRKEKEELEGYLDNLQTIVDRVVDLKIDGIKVINNETWELTEEFLSLGIDANVLNHTVSEIEEELDALSQSHEEYINKIAVAEENYKTLEALYKQQEKLIAELNKQVNTLREQVAKEKVLNREYTTQIERLKSEKSRIEKGYKLYKPYDRQNEEVNDEVYGVLSDLERLNEEVRKLITKDESKKVNEDIVKKDLEIENLKQQLESLRNKPQIKEQQEYLNPYYANGANMFMPRGYAYNQMMPQPNMFDFYLQEVEKLRNEIDGLKQAKMEEPIAKPEVFGETIAEVKAKPNVVVAPLVEPKVEVKVEEPKVVEQLQTKEEQTKDNESLEKIKELEKLIQEKDKYIEKVKQQMKEYTEEDIFDPNFKRKIRVIRDKKNELINRSKDEEQIYIENTKDINNQINVIKSNIDNVKDRIFDLDMNYRQNRDYSSAAKDEYEKAKGKALVELQLQEEKMNNYNEDLTRVKQKYDRFLKNKEDEIGKLNQEEVETIQFYLNKMIQDNKINSKLRSTEEEKQTLVNELDQLRSDNNSLVTEIDAYADDEKKKHLNNKLTVLETEIKEQTRQYNIYYEKISDLKTELTKRQELENNLKQNDDDVFEYTSIIQSLEDCQSDFNQKNEKIGVLQLEIENNGSSDKDAMLRKKAEISDLIVHREDLKTKMDFFKTKLEELESNANIATYKKINNQINQIKKVSRDHRMAAEALKADVQSKTAQLEKLKIELKAF